MLQDDGDDEKITLDALEAGTLKSSANASEEMKMANLDADNYLSNKTRANLRLYSKDVYLIDHKAAKQGLPYQTLIASILRQYATNQLELNKPI